MSTGAAAAAAAAEAACRQEEEEMSSYSPRDLADDWEFKIVRSAFGAFKNPERLAAVLDDERRAGWVLVEKFDNQRIRMKRPASARALDAKLDFDPYRSTIDKGQPALAAVVILAVLGAALVLGLMMAAVRTQRVAQLAPTPVMPAPAQLPNR